MIQKILIALLLFLIGAFSSSLYHTIQTDAPVGEIQFPRGSEQFSTAGYPQDWIEESQILVYSDRVTLDVKNAQWAKFTDTHSMEPVFGANSNAIEFEPSNPEQLQVGDIASYYSNIDQGVVIHRIVYIGEDEQGTYYIFKGDNNPSSDPEKVRFEQVQRVVAAIIY